MSLAAPPRALTASQRDRIRADGVSQVRRLTPLMLGATSIDMLTIDIVFWGPGREHLLIVWSLCAACAVALWGMWWWRKIRHIGPESHVDPGVTRRLSLLMALVGCIWVVPLVLFFDDAGAAQRVVIVASATGVIAGAAIALAPVWQAAVLFQLVVLAPGAFVLLRSGEPLFYYLVGLAAIFEVKILYQIAERGRLLVATHLATADLREQRQVISLLLKEFEENASDWLFELDARGRLTRCGERLARLLDRPAGELEGFSLAGLVDRRRPGGGAVARRLIAGFRSREALRDVLVPVGIEGAARWWSISAKPMLDSGGRFCGYRGVGSDVTVAREAEAKVERMARYDSLTGLPNRGEFMRRLAEALREDSGQGMALLALDLDRFKSVNDTLGHPVGDRLLQHVSEQIARLVCAGDVACRLGGDEFVILRRYSEAGELAAFSARLIAAIGAPCLIDGFRVLVGASIGVALAGRDGAEAQVLLRRADLALCRVKAEGRGRAGFYEPHMDAAVQDRRLIEIDLRDAIRDGAIGVAFQPIVDIVSGRIIGCEALARWSHPLRGPVDPATFISIAEETGMIVGLGACVMRAACAEAASWTRPLRVAVNVSATQFRSEDFAGFVRSVLAQTGLDPDRLELEITESILIADRGEALVTLNALRALGVRVALDDFGTGYSSLAYLTSFPFDKIKIDRGFVRGVDARPDAAVIVRSIVYLAAALGMRTTAEGVETPAELECLRNHACNEVQGYLFSPPMSPEALRPLIASGALRPGASPASKPALAA